MSFHRWVVVSSLLLSIYCVIIISHLTGAAATAAKQRRFNNTISAILIFGDSTVDSGNNNFIFTIAKCNFPPYGRDFLGHIPTGRFSNGRLVTDFIASYMGVKENVPPYLDQSLGVEELITGVSFASGGTGYDAFTAKSNVGFSFPAMGGVISVERQLQYFREYKKRLENLIGKEKTKWVVRNAAFFVSAGTNDLNNYFSSPSLRRQQYTLPAYQQFLIQLVQQFVLGLMEEGAQRIGVVGLPPIGCLPTTITRNSDSPLFHRHCLPTYSAAAREYNQLLQNKLRTIQNGALKLVYIDIFNPLEDMIQNPRKFGFNEVNRGCCGSGLFELSVLCNPESIVCSDTSKYMFWDAVHPTQATYSQLFKALVPSIDYIIKG
nr:GDSL esterase/lipase At5g45960-like [Ipomoea batatas]